MSKKRVVLTKENSNYITAISPPTPDPIKIVEFEKKGNQSTRDFNNCYYFIYYWIYPFKNYLPFSVFKVVIK